jgi:hypothetical protein
MASIVFGCLITTVVGAYALDGSSTLQLENLPPSALSSISAAMGRDVSTYYVQTIGSELLASNSEKTLLTRFSTKGLELQSGGIPLGIRLRAYGYGDGVRNVGDAFPRAWLNRVEYQRGQLTEWYVNGPAGLEQGFTIVERTAPTNAGPLTLVLTISREFKATIDSDKTGAILKGIFGGKDLRCAGLRATDATGRELRAWVEVRDQDLRLIVDERNAQYPIIVDPIIQLSELTASDGQLSYQPRLGVSVAISGNTVVAGAPGAQIGQTVGQGAVYVFVKPTNGWTNLTQTAKLTASDGGYVEGLGQAVAISGDTIIAGSDAMIGQKYLQGAVYVFVKPQSGWKDMTQTAKLTASDGQKDDLLGASVSISGNTIVAGAPYASQMAGKAYVFVMPTAGWKNMHQTGELTPSDPILDSIFGLSVRIDGDTIVVGEPYKNLAYVFVKPLSGWTDLHQTAKLSPSDVLAFDEFGSSVAINVNTVVIGKPSATNPGAVYVFIEPVNGWIDMTQTAKLTASDGTSADFFGCSIFTNGKVILAGAESAIVNSNGQQGAVYGFVKPVAGWKDTSKFSFKLTAGDGAAGYFFGFSVAASGPIAVIGAPYTNLGSDTTNPGAAYIFRHE